LFKAGHRRSLRARSAPSNPPAHPTQKTRHATATIWRRGLLPPRPSARAAFSNHAAGKGTSRTAVRTVLMRVRRIIRATVSRLRKPRWTFRPLHYVYPVRRIVVGR
jgi:hypothetical protein